MENLPKAISTILTAATPVVDAVGSTDYMFHARIKQEHRGIALRWYVGDVDPVDVKNYAPRMYVCTLHVEMFCPLTEAAPDTTLINIAEAVREALERYGHGVVNGVNLQGIKYLGGKYMPDDPDVIDMSAYSQAYQVRVVTQRNEITLGGEELIIEGDIIVES